MFNFSRSSKGGSVGIDFGTSSIKIVELEKRNGMIHLVNYGWIEIPAKKNIGEFNFDSESEKGEVIFKLIKKISDKMKLKTKSAHLSMGSYKGLSALVKVNNVNESELGEVIRLEAGKYIPVSLDEVYLSSDIVSRSGKKEDKSIDEKINNIFKKNESNEDMEILLVAAPKEDVHFYEGAVKSSGLEVASFERNLL